MEKENLQKLRIVFVISRIYTKFCQDPQIQMIDCGKCKTRS